MPPAKNICASCGAETYRIDHILCSIPMPVGELPHASNDFSSENLSRGGSRRNTAALEIRLISQYCRFSHPFRGNPTEASCSKPISAFRRAGVAVYKRMKLMNGYFAPFRRFLIIPDGEKEGFIYNGKVEVIARFGTEILDPAAHPVSSVGFSLTIFHLSTPTREGGRNNA